MNCIFCDIVSGKAQASVIAEDEKHFAFLNLFPNTVGSTLVIPKRHISSYAFEMEESELSDLVLFSKRVGLALDKAYGTARTSLVFEGYGVDHVHAKLFPLHGTVPGEWKQVEASEKKFYKEYKGFVSTHDGEMWSRDSLDREAAKIKAFLQ